METNLIIRHADDYFNRAIFDITDYEKFISYIKRNAHRYDTAADKIMFIDRIAFQLKLKYDRHMMYCSLHETCSCRFVQFFEAVLFYLQYELRKLENELVTSEFSLFERNEINLTLMRIVDHVNEKEIGSKLSYEVFIREMEELKNYYYLNKKIWHQLLIGKLTDMLGQRIVNGPLCEEILMAVETIAPELLMNRNEE